MAEQETKLGYGISQLQIESSELYKKLQPVLKQAQECYARWEKKNGFSSVHGHWDILDPIKKHGVIGLRAWFVMLRGERAGWIFGVISQIIKAEGLAELVIPKDEYGYRAKIRNRYLSWAEINLPPTAVELHLAAMLAQDRANEFWWYVVAPETKQNYGGTYFSGSMKQAEEYDELAASLRYRMTTMIEAQTEQWKKPE